MPPFTAGAAATDDERGTTIVEFALLAPVLVLLITGAVEFGYVAMARSALEGSTAAAARRAITGSCPLERSADMEARIVRAMSSFSSPDDGPEIIVKAYGEKFGDVGEMEPLTTDVNSNNRYDPADGDTFDDVNANGTHDEMGREGDLGGPGDVVAYTVSYNLTTLFPYTGSAFGTGTSIPLTATTVVRNEPIFMGKCDED